MSIKEFVTELVEEPTEPININPKLKKFGLLAIKCIAACFLASVIMLVYIEIGHTRNWPRAEQWHERMHRYGHFNINLYIK